MRRQEDIIYSFFVELYRHRLYKDKDNNTLDKYVKNGLKEKDQGHFHMFYYNRLIKVCENYFGSENLTVLIFEKMKNERKNYQEDLAKVLEIDSALIDLCLVEKN